MYTYKKLLLASALSALAFSAAGDPPVDSDTDSHDVTVTVPEVALIDVDDTEVICTLTAPTEAGLNFTDGTATSDYAITANVLLGQGTTNKIQVSVNTTPTVGANLKVVSAVPSSSGGTAVSIVTLSTTAQNLVTGMGNTVDASVALTYTCCQTGSSIASQDSDTVTVIYTIVAEAAAPQNI